VLQLSSKNLNARLVNQVQALCKDIAAEQVLFARPVQMHE